LLSRSVPVQQVGSHTSTLQQNGCWRQFSIGPQNPRRRRRMRHYQNPQPSQQ
jgi:hypothetical protein